MTSDASCLSGSVSSTPSPLPPIIVLSGSDRRPGRMPEGEQAFHPLSGYKGVDLRIDGRALVVHVIERLQASECFAAVYVAGPADAHREVIAGAGITEECLIDVDGRIGENVRAALEAVRRDFPGQPIAFTTCDVLPDAELLRRVMRRYGECVPCDVFFPLIAAPANEADMGASTWKPTYSLVDAPGEAPRKVLPGHLVIGDPDALRLDFLCRLLNLSYLTRNRSLAHRRNVMIRALLSELLMQDLRHLVTLRAPTVTWRVISTGIRVMTGLVDRTMSRAELERRARKIVVTGAHQRRYPERKVELPIIDGLALAMDIDTEEEARFFGVDAGLD